MIRSHSLLFTDFDTAWYKRWAKELKQDKKHLEGHQLKANKFWQNAVMVQALHERGLLKGGSAGVGFGVGRERLPALFAKHGVQVLATDQDFRTKKAKHWQKHELATGAQSLNALSICPPKEFAANVSYQAVDMRRLPKSLHNKYDFVWSNCALGHLGSIEAGLNFILESAKCLKPGGYAVHTTEINVINDRHTVDNNPQTVIFRPRDIYKLSRRLLAAGYELSPLKLDFGKQAGDLKISMAPQFGNDFSKLQVGGHLITQVVLVIKRPAKPRRLKRVVLQSRAGWAYVLSLFRQRQFARTNPLLKSIRSYEKTNLGQGAIKPTKTSLSTTLKGQPRDIYLEYVNKTLHPLFGMHERLHSTKPLALATSGPDDRPSPFKADDWFQGQANRPSIFICTKQKGRWEKADYIKPGAKFAYRVKLDPSGVKDGTYTEKFVIVQEGNQHLADTEVSVRVTVKR